MTMRNLLYAQSGGVTPVINATAYGVIKEATRAKKIAKTLAGRNGILGVLREELTDVGAESAAQIEALRHTPGGAFGSCRHKLPDPDVDDAPYRRLFEVFDAHDIGYFLYNGGGDSQDTTRKIDAYARDSGYPLRCIGIPKTIDNDLPQTDCCPGFGSVAKYIAISTREAGLDVASMCASSTKVFILEVMGRHAGWIAAASGLAAERPGDAPHLILFPEVAFERRAFLSRVKRCVAERGYCVIVASEGARDRRGRLLADSGVRDAFGHAQLGGVAPHLARMITATLKFKCHWAVADYLQRAARHTASKVDLEQAEAMGREAVKLALGGAGGVMPVIERRSGRGYRWSIGRVSVDKVANRERKIPRSWLSRDGFGIGVRLRDYLRPLIQGEAPPPYVDGLPRYARLKNRLLRKKLKNWRG